MAKITDLNLDQTDSPESTPAPGSVGAPAPYSKPVGGLRTLTVGQPAALPIQGIPAVIGPMKTSR